MLKAWWMSGRHSKERTAKRVGSRPERKRKNFVRLGIEQGQAYAWSRTRMGGWAVAQSPMLKTTITISRLKRRGYESMLDYYSTFQPSIPWTAVYETRTYGGVRGAPWALLLTAIYSIIPGFLPRSQVFIEFDRVLSGVPNSQNKDRVFVNHINYIICM